MERKEDNSKKIGISCVEMRDSEGKVVTIQGLRTLIKKKNHSKPVAQALSTSRVRQGIDEDEGDEERTGIYIKNKVCTPLLFHFRRLPEPAADNASALAADDEAEQLARKIDRANDHFKINQTDAADSGESEDDYQPDEQRVVKFYVVVNGLCILGDQELGRRDVIIATRHVERDVNPFTRQVRGAKQRA